jgi:hypothetical protein
MTTTPVTLTTEAFQSALANYIDETKPDPIVKRQLESWTLTWENEEAETPAAAAAAAAAVEDLFGDNNDDNGDKDTSDLWRNLNHRLQGSLTIQGEYVSVKLQFGCAWKGFDDSNTTAAAAAAAAAATTTTTTKEMTKKASNNNGILLYCCRVCSAKLVNPSDSVDKTERKIRQKMMQRLQQDSYISKLLALGSQKKSTDTPTFDPTLAKARIHVNETKFVLEERVDVSETVAEALRRALWSSAESSLDMVEVLLALPALPGTNHQPKNSSNSQSTTTTPLANRAKLRMLEDAMVDECEKEGEGELIQELSIDETKRDDGKKSSDDDGNVKQPHKHKKKKSRSKR